MSLNLSALPTGTGIPDEAEVGSLARKVDETSAALGRRIADLTAAVESARQKWTDEERARMRSATSTTGGNGLASRAADTGLDKLAERLAEKRVAEFRETALAESERDRVEMIRQLRETSERLALLEVAYPSPVAMLQTYGIGSESRSRYEQQVAGLGPAALQTLATQAVLSKNLALGAALLGALDRLPAASRPVTGQALAEKLLGAEHEAVVAASARARLAYQSAIVADRELRTGRRDSLSKIARGLAVQTLRKAAPPDPKPSPAPEPPADESRAGRRWK